MLKTLWGRMSREDRLALAGSIGVSIHHLENKVMTPTLARRAALRPHNIAALSLATGLPVEEVVDYCVTQRVRHELQKLKEERGLYGSERQICVA